MRIKLFCLSLLFVAGNATAQWTRHGGVEGAAFYVDLTAVEKSGNTARMWSLRDFDQPQSKGPIIYSSRVVLTEYDCVDRRSRDLQSSTFTGKMRTGEVTYTSPTSTEWQYVEPGSAGEELLKVACKSTGKRPK